MGTKSSKPSVSSTPFDISFENKDIEQKNQFHSPYLSKETINLNHYLKKQIDSFQTEFSHLKKWDKHVVKQASSPFKSAEESMDKNRWPNVLALEKTRVKLGDNGYFNANWIHRDMWGYRFEDLQDFKIGTKTEKIVSGEEGDNSSANDIVQRVHKPVNYTYIAGQAPIPNTFHDFWYLIFQENISCIIMVTQLEERYCRKADKYWPDSGTEVTEKGVSVALVSIKHNDHFIERKLKISAEHEGQSYEKVVTHLQMSSWPDFGVPKSTAVLRDLIHHVDSLQIGPDSPIFIHCSAGIGRTGTFISVHVVLQQMRYHLSLFPTGNPPFRFNFFKVVQKIKACRIGSVQTPQQYGFIHQCVLDEIMENDLYKPIRLFQLKNE